MQKEIIIAGFGGQGVLFGGQVVAYAAMDAGKEVTWIPSYGPEMRGGTANCTVVIADEEIGSPLVKNPPLAIALNLPSFDKYEETLAPGGTLIVNQSMVDRERKARGYQCHLCAMQRDRRRDRQQEIAEHGRGRRAADGIA